MLRASHFALSICLLATFVAKAQEPAATPRDPRPPQKVLDKVQASLARTIHRMELELPFVSNEVKRVTNLHSSWNMEVGTSITQILRCEEQASMNEKEIVRLERMIDRNRPGTRISDGREFISLTEAKARLESMRRAKTSAEEQLPKARVATAKHIAEQREAQARRDFLEFQLPRARALEKEADLLAAELAKAPAPGNDLAAKILSLEKTARGLEAVEPTPRSDWQQARDEAKFLFDRYSAAELSAIAQAAAAQQKNRQLNDRLRDTVQQYASDRRTLRHTQLKLDDLERQASKLELDLDKIKFGQAVFIDGKEVGVADINGLLKELAPKVAELRQEKEDLESSITRHQRWIDDSKVHEWEAEVRLAESVTSRASELREQAQLLVRKLSAMPAVNFETDGRDLQKLLQELKSRLAGAASK